MTSAIIKDNYEDVNYIEAIHNIEPFNFDSGDVDEISEQFGDMCVKALGKSIGEHVASTTSDSTVEEWVEERLPANDTILGKTYAQTYDYAFQMGD